MFKNISRIINSHAISQLFNLGEKTAAWKKVRELKAGMRIAIAPTSLRGGTPTWQSIQIDSRSPREYARDDTVEWDEIISIKKLHPERVWDIEVEGTHNFVGNGIVAHNTSGILMRAGASSLQLSSGATSTTADIELAAADQIDLFAGRFSLTTSSGTAGDVKIDSAGTLTLSTSRNNTNVALLSGTGAFNVTAGTTTQTYSGNNQNAILLQASNGGIQLSTGSVGNGSLRLLSSGSLTIETSQNNTNISILPGSGGVALGVSTPAGSATLDISSTTKGFLPPRMTTTQRDNISSPTKGLVIFNDTTAALNVYSGTAWGAVGSGGGGGSCNGSNDCIIVLTPEYPNTIISADGTNNVGTVTSDLTISASNYYYNYYEFASGQASLQDYDVYVSWQLPSGWADWDDAQNAISIDLATEDPSSANTKVDATVYRQSDADSYSETANVSPTAGEWRTTLEGKSVLDITKTNLNTIQNPWAAGDILVIKLKLYSKDNYYSRIGNIRIIYENQ